MTDFPIINAVLSNRQEGHVYHLDGAGFIIHKAGFAYVDLKASINLKTMLDFLSSEKSLPQYFHMYDPPKELMKTINNDKRFGTRLRKRVQLRYMQDYPPKLDGLKTALETDIRSIDSLIFPKLKVFKLNLKSRFWNGVDDFMKNSYGSVAIVDNQPVSICYAASIANGIAEIDVATLPDYRGSGLAKIVAQEFVKQSIKRGITANWDCFQENKESLNLAKRINFQYTKEYLLLSISKLVEL